MQRQFILNALQSAYDTQTLGMRPLLMPKTISIGKHIMQYEAKLCDWARLGFGLDQVGPEQVLVRSMPELLGAQFENLEALIIALLGATDLDQCLEIMVNHALCSAHFSM